MSSAISQHPNGGFPFGSTDHWSLLWLGSQVISDCGSLYWALLWLGSQVASHCVYELEPDSISDVPCLIPPCASLPVYFSESTVMWCMWVMSEEKGGVEGALAHFNDTSPIHACRW